MTNANKISKDLRRQHQVLYGKRIKNTVADVTQDLSRRSRMRVVSSVSNKQGSSILSEYNRRTLISSGQAMLNRTPYTGRNSSLHRYSPVI
jgi:ribosomal protein S3AE